MVSMSILLIASRIFKAVFIRVEVMIAIDSDQEDIMHKIFDIAQGWKLFEAPNGSLWIL